MTDIHVSEKHKYNLIRDVDEAYGHGLRQAEYIRSSDDAFCLKFRTLVDDIETALDVGCGGGTIMDIVKSNCSVVGVDISDEPKRSRPDLDIHTMSASALSFDDSSFDLVYHLDGLEHIPEEIEDDVIREEFRVAQKFVAHQIALVPSSHDDEFVEMGLTPLHINLKPKEQWLNKIDAVASEFGFNRDLTFVETFSWWALPLRQKLLYLLKIRKRRKRLAEIGRDIKLYIIYTYDG